MIELIREVLHGAGGYIGVFMVSLVSNAIPYSTIPYLFWLIPFFTRYRDLGNLIIAVAVSALGASVGKLIVYFVGRGLSTLGSESRFKQNISYLTNKHSKAVFLTVFLAAALPIPDDVVYIPVGYARYSVPLFFTALLAGKLVITVMAAIYGRALSFLFEERGGLPVWLSIVLYIFLTIIVMYVAGSINWINVSNIAGEKGVAKAIDFLLKEIALSLKRIPGRISFLIKRILGLIRRGNQS
ncbi:MAG: VTT domain-containing protein [Desulfurococcus sp.]|uniref:VTT domain-containing protein n=1 Tax=Desulfurococcus sp. TaxID=51678 RepID=UPI00315F5E5E